MRLVRAVLPWLLIGVIVYQNISLAFVEGDDASTILFHAAGRDSHKQLPYSPYQSFFDWMLSFLPATNVDLLISAAIFLSILGGVLTLFSIKSITQEGHSWFLLTLLFTLPELLFMLLYINPAILAMGFYSLAFLLVLHYKKKPATYLWVTAAISMGLAMAIRWNFIMGFFTFLPFLLTTSELRFTTDNLRVKALLQNGVTWFFVTSLSVGFGLIFISGYTLSEFIEIVLWGKEYMADTSLHPIMVISSISGFITPALLILFVLGLVRTLNQKARWLLVVFLFSLLPFALLGFNPSFKYNLTLVLPLVIMLSLGFQQVMQKRLWVKMVFSGILLFPWLFGLHINLPNTAWGPGLSFNIPNSPKEKATQKTGIRSTRLSFLAGNAMPNPEGVRPFYGYGDALLFGAWGTFNMERAAEREALVAAAEKEDCILFADRPVALLQMAFVKKGYQLAPPIHEKGNVWRRVLKHPELTTQTQLITPGDFQSVTAFSQLIEKELFENPSCGLFYLTYSSLMPSLLEQLPQAVATSAVSGQL